MNRSLARLTQLNAKLSRIHKPSKLLLPASKLRPISAQGSELLAKRLAARGLPLR